MIPEILIAEDDPAIVELVKFNLEQEGYRVQVAGDGDEALRKARYSHPDLLILDLMLPVYDGLYVCRTLRQELDVSILVVSARRETEDRVLGLETGADDYLPKPFSVRELRARVKAVLRRRFERTGPQEDETVLRLGRITLRPQYHEVSVAGEPVTLSPKEFTLLATMLANPGRVMTRDTLLKRVWDYADLSNSESLYVHISNLRRKIEPNSHCRLTPVKGLGYKITELGP